MNTPETDVLGALWAAAIHRSDHGQAGLLEQAIEATREAPPPVTLDAAAWWYAQGEHLHVFPLQPGSKIPYKGSRGCKDATADPETVARWWQLAPESNIGVATGHRFDVVDIDGDEGARSFRDMVVTDSQGAAWLVLCGVSQTPRGMHLWVPAVPGARNGAGGAGLDYRAHGGYVVAPPSQVDGTVYRWLLPPQEGETQ